MMTEDEYFESLEYALTDLDAVYPCPDVDCDGVVEYERTGHWQCSECYFRDKHIPNARRFRATKKLED
jgi:hypothetical protein